MSIDVFPQYLAEYAEERDWSVVIGIVKFGSFRNGYNIGEFPSIWYFAQSDG